MVQVLKDLASLLLVVIVLGTLSSSHYLLLLLSPVRSCFLMDNVLHFAHRPTNPLYASRLLYYPLSCFIFPPAPLCFPPQYLSHGLICDDFQNSTEYEDGIGNKGVYEDVSSVAFDQKETCTGRWKSNDAKAWKRRGGERCTSTCNGKRMRGQNDQV